MAEPEGGGGLNLFDHALSISNIINIQLLKDDVQRGAGGGGAGLLLSGTGH